ncbi:acyltransferase [Gordonia insulae]|uniref:Streptogramin A acetyltransferase n=1 Tax=Gordonia insulae TaxID=2420509 RepID=A0A3G8JV98_9ACTN|nr:DapH/DapD/GlmU-related protein [Gordonia insulae]AZG48090.1 Streptogramin A acetyltransferase [Gordonia insulae]
MNGLAIDSDNVTVGAGFNAGRGVIVSAPHKLLVGNNVSIGPRSVVQVDGTIGNFVMIGMNVHIVGRDDHAIDQVGVPMLLSTWVGDRDGTMRDAVAIGDDVWIGASAVVLSGVTIGRGSVIAAGSVVTSDTDEYSLNAGVPAKKIGDRFDGDDDRMRHSLALDELSRADQRVEF